jgi:L-serine deaminase
MTSPHKHRFAVSAYNAYGHKTSTSITVNGGVAPQLPTNITATADAGNDTVTVSWAGDANVEWYYVWEKNLVTGKWHSVKISGDRTSYTFSGMTSPHKHKFAVSAYNAYGHKTSTSITVP